MLHLSINHFTLVSKSKSSPIRLLYLIFSILQHTFIIPINSNTLPQDLAINCGSSSESNSTWTGDTNYSKSFSLFEPQRNQSSIAAISPQFSDSKVNRVPYGTARLSHYEFTYSLHVSAGPKFLRLHFHPASYPNFHRSMSLFSLKAGPYTLLKDFNASRVSDEGGDPQKKILLMEYCIKIEQGNQRLNLTFTPNHTTHADSHAFINGIEVLSLVKSNLHCSKPNYSSFKFVSIIHETKTNLSSSGSTAGSDCSKTKFVGVFCVAVVSVFILGSVIYLLCIWFRKMARTEVEVVSEEISNKSISVSSSNLCRHFSIIEIRAATINFDDIFVVGVGGFGKVYKGYIDDGTIPVAIKRFIPNCGQGVQEFKTEVEMLSQLSHPHLVSLIGFCNDEDDMIIVYDFMANGTLRDHLHGSSAKAPLSWKQRLEICIGAGLGLQYLHNGAKYSIIHRDVKSSNILLDEKWVAKISDFGLCKFGPNGVSKFHVTTQVKGSLGYLDPEYSKTKWLTHKSDVYSFGVVLLEVLCGRPPLLRKVEGQERILVEWARTCHSEGPQAIDQMVDPFLRGTIVPKCLDKFVEVALNCVVCDGNERPSMSDVVEGLELALQLQQSIEEEDPRSQIPKNSTV
ncbi:Serine-threonine/tyrosine-protein kinase, catalytic domain [Sesbania bispinosa]|nr:Serine-threonine/tyrosine-protein kinase, catalytic domain [Sesbania bispinosa]